MNLKLFKMRLIWMRYKRNIIMIIGVTIIAAILIIYFNGIKHPRYFYIDMQGNKGVAIECKEDNGSLICNKEYGGKIIVQQYWKGE